MTRKQVVFLATSIAAILAVSSVAWACITFVGDMQVRSTRANSDSDWVTGKGGTSSMEYCSGGAGGVTNAADAVKGTHTITVEVKAATGCNADGLNKFAATAGLPLHDIRLRGDGGTSGAYTGSDGSWTWVANMGCFTGASYFDLGDLSVDTSGNGTTSGISLNIAGLDPNDVGEAAVVCAGGGANQTGKGNFNPLVVL